MMMQTYVCYNNFCAKYTNDDNNTIDGDNDVCYHLYKQYKF